MASSGTPAISSTTEPPESKQEDNLDLGRNTMIASNAESGSLEMSDLSASKAGNVQSLVEEPSDLIAPQPTTIATSNTNQPDNSNTISSIPQEDGTRITARISEEESAIGPATERPLANVRTNPSTGVQLVITLLLHSTDTRHPYIITEKYLQKRNIAVAGNDPVNLTVYNLKDLIWRDWRDDWEARPASPTSIRLIHMGRMLDDKAYLKDSRFVTGELPHVVHMSIKPQEAIDDEDARIAKGSTRDRDESQRNSRCTCVIL